MIDFTAKFDGLSREKVTIAKAGRRTLLLRSRVFVPSAPVHRRSVGYPERLPADLTIRRNGEDQLSASVHRYNASEIQKDESKG
jgi:hypothetical protein